MRSHLRPSAAPSVRKPPDENSLICVSPMRRASLAVVWSPRRRLCAGNGRWSADRPDAAAERGQPGTSSTTKSAPLGASVEHARPLHRCCKLTTTARTRQVCFRGQRCLARPLMQLGRGPDGQKTDSARPAPRLPDVLTNVARRATRPLKLGRRSARMGSTRSPAAGPLGSRSSVQNVFSRNRPRLPGPDYAGCRAADRPLLQRPTIAEHRACPVPARLLIPSARTGAGLPRQLLQGGFAGSGQSGLLEVRT
jgi:hypothetical protein